MEALSCDPTVSANLKKKCDELCSAAEKMKGPFFFFFFLLFGVVAVVGCIVVVGFCCSCGCTLPHIGYFFLFPLPFFPSFLLSPADKALKLAGTNLQNRDSRVVVDRIKGIEIYLF